VAPGNTEISFLFLFFVRGFKVPRRRILFQDAPTIMPFAISSRPSGGEGKTNKVFVRDQYFRSGPPHDIQFMIKESKK